MDMLNGLCCECPFALLIFRYYIMYIFLWFHLTLFIEYMNKHIIGNVYILYILITLSYEFLMELYLCLYDIHNII